MAKNWLERAEEAMRKERLRKANARAIKNIYDVEEEE